MPDFGSRPELVDMFVASGGEVNIEGVRVRAIPRPFSQPDEPVPQNGLVLFLGLVGFQILLGA
jgi:hypothetical protein